VVGVGAIAALSIGASFSLFSGTSSTSPITFAAGTVTLATPVTDTCPILTPMEPGDNGTCSVSVAYAGTLPAYIGVEGVVTNTVAGSGGGLLGNVLAVTYNSQSVTNFPPALVGHGTEGTSFVVPLVYTLPTTAGNIYQGAQATLTVTFYAVQCSYNGLNSNGSLDTTANETCGDSAPASWSEVPAGTYTTTNGVEVLNDQGNCTSGYGGSPCFGPPNTGLAAGATTSLSVGIVQTTTVNPYASFTLSWNGNMTFEGIGDGVCTPNAPTSAGTVTCTVSDAAHGPGASDPKSDSFSFLIGSNPTDTVITVDITVTTGSTPSLNDGGTATAQAYLTTS